MIVPPAAGVFSAVGLLFADVEVAVSRGYLTRLDQADPRKLDALFRELETTAQADLSDATAEVIIERRLDIRYQGQAFELSIDVKGVPDLAAASERFDEEHEATYGHRLAAEHHKQIVTLRVVARELPAVPPRLDAAKLLAGSARRASGRRPVYFGGHDYVQADVVGRAELTGEPRSGPMIIEEYEGTTVVPPDARVHLDEHGNIVIDLATGLEMSTTMMARDSSQNSTDSLLLEIIRNGFSTVADEMALILMRSAHSMIVRDSMDLSPLRFATRKVALWGKD